MSVLTPDNLFDPWPHDATAAILVKDGTRLRVAWSNSLEDDYPLLWLRFNCMCGDCFNKDTYSRNIHLLQKSTVESITIHDTKKCIILDWSGGHTSEFTFEFLGQRSFREEQIQMRMKAMRYERLPCVFEEKGVRLNRYDFSDILENDQTFCDFADHLLEYGGCILTNAPRDACEKLSKGRDVLVRRCHYGDTWDVTTKLNPNNLSYTGKALGLHVDVPFLVTKVEIQLLHCLATSTSGGLSILSDGLMAAKILQKDYPQYFEVLSTKKIDHFDVGTDKFGDFFLASRRNIIELHEDGSVKNMIVSPSAISDYATESIEDTELWYDACNKLFEIAQDRQTEFALKAGEVLVFDNLRLMHGRTAFEPTASETTNRHLRGWYFDWEFLLSSVRCCRARLNKASRV